MLYGPNVRGSQWKVWWFLILTMIVIKSCLLYVFFDLQIVNLIEKTGHFNVTNTTFDFDLFSLDESTVRKLQSYLDATST